MTYEFEYHFILFSAIFLIIGYLLRGDSQKNNLVAVKDDETPESFFKIQNKRKSSKDKTQKSSIIDIDESTHVVKIKTDGLEKGSFTPTAFLGCKSNGSIFCTSKAIY